VIGNDPGEELGEIAEHAILIHTRDDFEIAVRRMRSGDGHLLPVLDVSGMNLPDVDQSVDVGNGWPETAIDLIRQFAARRLRLAPWLRESSRPDLRLLAYMYVHDRELTARYDAVSPAGFSYGDLLPETKLSQLTQRLCAAGYLHATFFDCFNGCSACHSTRLNVREECPACRTSDIADVRLLHHFRCANLAPEEDYRAPGEKLTCPKCARELRHYGSDHETAGNAVKCVSCGYIGSEPVVGFVCLDCSTHFDAASSRKVRVFNYRLSEAAMDFLHSASDAAAISDSIFGISLPLGLLQQIRAACARGDDFLVAEVVYENEGLGIKRGSRQLAASRAHFRSTLAAEIAEFGQLVAGGSIDYVFMPEHSPDRALKRLRNAVARSDRTLRQKLAPELRIFSKADLVA